MTSKKQLFAALAALALQCSVPAAEGAWERVRSSDAPLAVISASSPTASCPTCPVFMTGDPAVPGTWEISTTSFAMSFTVGEGCAALSPTVNGADSVWSGYYSVQPYGIPDIGFFGFGSTNGVTLEGSLWGAKPDDDIKLLFSTDISSTISRPELVVTRVMDNNGQAVNEPWSSPLDYTVDYSGPKLLIAPVSGWPKGSVFSVYYSSRVTDINGYPVSGATTVYFTIRMDHQTDNTAAVLSDRNAKVFVPANAYPGDYYLTLSTASGGSDITGANAALAGLPGSPQFLGTLSVRAYDASGGPAQPGLACVVTLPYRDDNNDGFVEGGTGRIKPAGLSVWRLDEPRKLWVRQAGPSVNGALKLVSQSVPHFSNYALMGLPDTDLTAAYVFPVPFRPNAGDTARYGSWATGITFTNLPSYGTIKIYTLSGELVRSLDIASAQVLSQVVWDVKNSGGAVVASGVYIWEITAGGNRKTGKLIVIK